VPGAVCFAFARSFSTMLAMVTNSTSIRVPFPASPLMSALLPTLMKRPPLTAKASARGLAVPIV
jgi:hypothetical protein